MELQVTKKVYISKCETSGKWITGRIIDRTAPATYLTEADVRRVMKRLID